MIVRMMPEYAKQVASPLANIDKITVVDTGGGEGGGANKVTSYATNLMGSLQETLKASSGIDVKELIEAYVGKSAVKQYAQQMPVAVPTSVQPKEEKSETVVTEE